MTKAQQVKFDFWLRVVAIAGVLVGVAIMFPQFNDDTRTKAGVAVLVGLTWIAMGLKKGVPPTLAGLFAAGFADVVQAAATS